MPMPTSYSVFVGDTTHVCARIYDLIDATSIHPVLDMPLPFITSPLLCDFTSLRATSLPLCIPMHA